MQPDRIAWAAAEAHPLVFECGHLLLRGLLGFVGRRWRNRGDPGAVRAVALHPAATKRAAAARRGPALAIPANHEILEHVPHVLHHALPELGRALRVEHGVAATPAVEDQRAWRGKRDEGIAMLEREGRIPAIREDLLRGDREHRRGLVGAGVAAWDAQHFLAHRAALGPPGEDRDVRARLLVHAPRRLAQR